MKLGPSTEIRIFEEGNTASVIELWSSVFGYETAHNDPRLSIQRKLALQPELFLVAELNGRIVGTIMGGYDGHRGWVYSLAVAPESRGRGIGSALLRHLESALCDLGCLKVNLQVREDNADVVEFYRRHGYAVEPRVSMGKVL